VQSVYAKRGEIQTSSLFYFSDSRAGSEKEGFHPSTQRLAGGISAVDRVGDSFRIYLFSHFLMRVDSWETVLYIL
jgi:hypothetical protein